MSPYEPGLRRQSAEWHTPSSSGPGDFRRVQSKLKLFIIFAYDTQGVLASNKVPAGKTVNTASSIFKSIPDQLFERSDLGPVVQSVVSLTSSLRVILLTVLADSDISC